MKSPNLPFNNFNMTFVFFFFHLKTSSSSMKESKEILIPFFRGGESFTGKHLSYQDLKASINIALKAYYK